MPRTRIWIGQLLRMTEDELADVPSQLIDEKLSVAKRVLEAINDSPDWDTLIPHWLAITCFLHDEWDKYD